MFEPYLKSFYIRSTDPTQIKILKVSDGQTCRPPFHLTLTPTPTDPQISTVATVAQEAGPVRVGRELPLAYHLLDICRFSHVK